MRKCTKCHIEKPDSEFIVCRSKKRVYKQNRCRSCYNKYNREWRASKGAAYRERSKKRWHDRLNAMTDQEREEFNAKLAKKTRDANKRRKDAVYAAYGGYKCACCGETEESFLTIDHVNNDGATHRKAINSRNGGTPSIHRWLIENDFPEGFQVLCWNCQWGKVKNNGICPHRRTCNDYPATGVGSSDPKRSAPYLTVVKG